MIKGFKDFLFRGNVVDLAVAFVIGAAFAAVVSSFVGAIVTPIVNAFPGGNSNGLGFSLRHTKGAVHGSATDVLGKSTFLNFSTIINAIIVFVITAAVVYFVFVVPVKKMKELQAKRVASGEEAEEAVAPTDEVLALREIRDLLAQRNA